MYDVIVIGARCAGAPTAMLLARKGYRVLLLDRVRFPKEIPHGHFIHRHGPRRLHRWGLLDRIVSTNCPPVESIIVDLDDFPLMGNQMIIDGVALGYGPRRALLDKVLVDAAVEAGAELREEFVVDDFLTEGERITGIRGQELANGKLVTERAFITVGADGRRSRLARVVRAAVYEAHPAVACWYFSYWSGMPPMGLEVYVKRNRVIFAFPTNDALAGIFIAWPSAELKTVRSDIEASFMAVLDQVPDFAERVRSGKREERFYGTTDLPNFFRKPYGPGWALVGDAGCHKDPYLALGICDAFRDAEWLSDAIDEGLSGRRSVDTAMAEYERRRNEATMPDYMENLALAQFKPIPAEVSQLRLALRSNQEDTNRFFLAREGMIPRETFFNPENLTRIMGTVKDQSR